MWKLYKMLAINLKGTFIFMRIILRRVLQKLTVIVRIGFVSFGIGTVIDACNKLINVGV